jgi:ABC-2 type transport system permease protein
MSFFTAFRKEWLEQRRSKKLLIALIVLTLFGMTSPLLAKFTPQLLSMIPGAAAFSALVPQPTISDAIGQYIKNTMQFAILLALLFGMGSVASEKERGTAALVLSKPLPRSSFLLAKAAAQALTFLLSIAAAGLACYYYTYALFGALDPLNWLALNGLLLFYMLIYVAVTLFFSTLTRTQYVAIGGSFGVLILLSILASIPGWAAYLPDGLVSNAVQLMTGNPVGGWQSVWVSLGILIAALLADCLVFRRQEI